MSQLLDENLKLFTASDMMQLAQCCDQCRPAPLKILVFWDLMICRLQQTRTTIEYRATARLPMWGNGKDAG